MWSWEWGHGKGCVVLGKRVISYIKIRLRLTFGLGKDRVKASVRLGKVRLRVVLSR